MHLSMVSPRVGGGGLPTGNWLREPSPEQEFWHKVGNLTCPPVLEDLENLEMTYIVFAILVLKRLLFLPGGGTPGNSWYPIQTKKCHFPDPAFRQKLC